MSVVCTSELATIQNHLPVWSPVTALPGEERAEGESFCGPEQGHSPLMRNLGR